MKTHAPAPAAVHKPKSDKGPPEHIEANELVTLLETLPRPHKIVPYPRKLPGTSQPISHLGIVAAYMTDKIMAQAAAHKYAMGVLADPEKAIKEGRTKLSEDEIHSLGYNGIFKNAAALELLQRVCMLARRKRGSDSRDLGADDYELKLPLEPAFASVSWMRKFCTDDEIGVLTATFLRAQSEIGPIVALLSDAECDLWIERLIQGGVALDPLDSLASGALIDLLKRSAFHLRNLRMGRSSSGEPLESGSTESTSSSDPSDEGRPPFVELDAPPHVDMPEDGEKLR